AGCGRVRGEDGFVFAVDHRAERVRRAGDRSSGGVDHAGVFGPFRRWRGGIGGREGQAVAIDGDAERRRRARHVRFFFVGAEFDRRAPDGGARRCVGRRLHTPDLVGGDAERRRRARHGGDAGEEVHRDAVLPGRGFFGGVRRRGDLRFATVAAGHAQFGFEARDRVDRTAFVEFFALFPFRRGGRRVVRDERVAAVVDDHAQRQRRA